MLTAHRDQENLAHSQQVPTKQQHKTPGSRYPKTPSRYGQHDENAPNTFAGKTGQGGAKTFLGNDKTVNKSTQQALVTPMGTRGRAPLGNKTTNAKARTGQMGAGNHKGQGVEKTQLKPTIQKSKQQSVDLAPISSEVKSESRPFEEEEPEYAPPRPHNLPYESDCFPRDLLSLEGLKEENLFKGYYQHFYNPLDAQGISKQEREYGETMKKVVTKAEERNKQQTDALSFNINDLSDMEQQTRATAVKSRNGLVQKDNVKIVKPKQPSTIASRRAASVLSVHSDTAKNARVAPNPRTTKPRKPLSSLLQGKKPVARTKVSHAESATGEAASRTTIGYNRGRSASSMLQKQTPVERAPERSIKPASSLDSLESDLTITPTRLRQAATRKQESEVRPQFTSIFDGTSEDDDLPPVKSPAHFSDDEEDEFELKLNL